MKGDQEWRKIRIILLEKFLINLNYIYVIYTPNILNLIPKKRKITCQRFLKENWIWPLNLIKNL